MESIPRPKCSALCKSTRVQTSLPSQRRPGTERVLASWSHPTRRSVSLSTGSSTSPTFLRPPRNISRSVMNGFPNTNWEVLSMVLWPRPPPSSSSPSSGDNHSSEDSHSQCSQWPTSWDGATCGDTRTGGAVPRKSLWPTRSSQAPEASSLWSDSQLNKFNLVFNSFYFYLILSSLCARFILRTLCLFSWLIKSLLILGEGLLREN